MNDFSERFAPTRRQTKATVRAQSKVRAWLGKALDYGTSPEPAPTNQARVIDSQAEARRIRRKREAGRVSANLVTEAKKLRAAK